MFFLVATSFLAACHSEEENENVPLETETQEENTRLEENNEPESTLAESPVQQLDPNEVFNTRVRLGLEPPPNLVVQYLLTRADVRELSLYEGTLTGSTLVGIEPSPNYNAFRIQSETGYGIGLQRWLLTETRQTMPRFQRLHDTYFEANDDNDPIGDGAFYGNIEGIRHYAFAHQSSRSVVVVTCETAICSLVQVKSLAERVFSRL